MPAGVVNRSVELETVGSFLSSAESQPSGLLMEGEAGIGKTTLWLAALDQARERGFQVLAARAWEAESVLAYGAVADLLGDVDSRVLAGLPDVQLVAVDRVLLRDTANGPATDQRVVAAALLSIIEACAKESPVLVAIDDLQWLDASSRAVFGFVARRLKGRAGVLATQRTERDHATASCLQLTNPVGIQRVRLGPLSLGGLRALISERIERPISRPTVVRIAEASDGNPFYALEMARAIDGRSPNGEPDLPHTLAELMRIRLGHLDDDVRDVLLAAACVGEPTVDLLAEATDTAVGRVVELLEDVESRGILGIEGNRVRFSHPLLARSVHNDAPPALRRATHRALAAVVEQPELKARHLAMAATSADPDTLQALDDAAEVARGRGAPVAAAEMLELAIGLGGDTPLRRIKAADHHFQAGDADQAVAHLEPTIERLPPGPLRSVALTLRAGMRIYENGFADAVALLKQALDDAEGVPQLRARTLMLSGLAQVMAGEFEDGLRNARKAVARADDLGRPALISQALSALVHSSFQCGHGLDEAGLQRALELEDPDSDAPIMFRASLINALLLAYRGRLKEAHTRLAEVRQRCEERGAEGDLMAVAGYGTLINIWRGNFTEAARLAEEAVERARQIGGDQVLVIPLTVRAAVASYLGRVNETRADATAALKLAQRCGSHRMSEWPMMSLGFLEVSRGNHGEALSIMAPLVEKFGRIPGAEIMHACFIPEAVEAMVALGRLDEAERLIAPLEEDGRRLDRAWMLAIAARCRAMLLAAGSDVEAAVEMAERAMTEHDRLPMPFERARTQLLLGQLQRRLRHKQAAAETLSEALSAFEEMGTPLWAERAREELARTNVGPTRDLALTPSEQRVAELVASGMTTRDVAAKLFISAKTVEANLTRIYRKLGIHSRAQLGRLMG